MATQFLSILWIVSLKYNMAVINYNSVIYISLHVATSNNKFTSEVSPSAELNYLPQ
jgi:hypothetical protein